LRPADDGAVTEEEIRIMIAEGTQAGVFHEAEREIMESVFRLGDRRVGELMQPRPRVVWLDADDPLEVNWSILTEESRSYVPVARGDLDNLLGLAPSKRLLASAAAGHPVDLLASLEQPTFVPETMSALRLLEQLRNAHPRIGMVIDEHGVIVGLVTPTDILEAIVGDLPEPGDRPDPAAVRREDGSWLIDGLLPVGDLDELVGAGGLTDDERAAFRTVGGLVMHELERVPAPGDRVVWRGVHLEVRTMVGRRIDKVLMTQTNTPPPAERTDVARSERDA
jgi:putative hemolysin